MRGDDVRPGPKAAKEDVQNAIIDLLRTHPEGLNFNEIFRRLKEERILGSFSILSRALKDLSKSRIVSYRDLEKPSYKIPKRIYALTPKTQSGFRNIELEQPRDYREIEATEQMRDLEEVSVDFLGNIKKPSEAAFLSVLLHHARALAYVYEQIIDEDGNPKGLWRLLLSNILRSQRRYMETRAEWARSRKIPMEKKQELDHIREILSRWIKVLTIYGISLQKELVEKENTTGS